METHRHGSTGPIEPQLVMHRRIGSVKLVTLNRPAVRNAVNYDLAAAICQSFQDGGDAAAISPDGYRS